MIKGSSKENEVDALTTWAHLLAYQEGAAIWYEWVDTDSNPADGLSRDGLCDEWTLRQGWELHECQEPPALRTSTSAEVLERFHLNVGDCIG